MRNYICLVLVLLCLGACGKRGDPVPRDQKNVFRLEKIEARYLDNDCLSLGVILGGAAQNVQDFSLELEPLNTQPDPNLPPELQLAQDTCEGCPFTPRQVVNLKPDSVQNSLYNFTYCPKPVAAGYRLRLVVKNVFLSFPYVLSPIKTIHRVKTNP